MTLEEAAYAEAEKWLNSNYKEWYQREKCFKAGAKWFQENHSCCCAGCGKHNLALTTEKQNSEFDEL